MVCWRSKSDNYFCLVIASGVLSLAATGTIPMIYKGSTYYVLITVWVPFDYPSKAPSASVIATDGLAVPPSHSFVSPQGHVDFRKLDFEWDNSYHLVFLVETLQQAFGSEPPLRRQAVAQVHPPHVIQTQQPPAYHATGASTNGTNAQTSHQPPRVASPGYHVSTSSSPSHSPAPGSNGNASNNPTYPNTGTGNQSSSSSMMGIQPTLANDASELLEVTSSQLYSLYYDTLADEDRQNQLTANTLDEWDTKHKYTTARLAEQQKVQEECANATKLLEAEINVLERAAAQRREEASNGTIDYDALAEPADPAVRMALACHAKDLAIDDTLYHLEKALQNGTIDLKVFLKVYRDLSNDQYYQRALLRKLNIQIPSSDI